MSQLTSVSNAWSHELPVEKTPCTREGADGGRLDAPRSSIVHMLPGAPKDYQPDSRDNATPEIPAASLGMDAAVARLAEALTTASQASHAPARDDGDIKKFIARQSVGKELPTFTGNPEDWPIWIHRFRTTTAECDFSDSENLSRLQKCLKGKAKDAVSALLTVPGNVPEVLRCLEVRFGRADLIVRSLISKAKSVRMVRADDFDSLIEFTTSVRNLVETMKLLKSTGHMTNPQLQQELVEKLPHTLKLQWGEHVEKKSLLDADLSEFAMWLSDKAAAASHITTFKPSSHDGQPPRRKFESVLAVASDSSERKCTYCHKASHVIADCRKFAGLKRAKRWAWVKEEKCCFVCLGRGHQVANCPDKRECPERECGKFHHQLLHVPLQSEQEVCAFGASTSGVVMLRVLPVTLYGPAGNVTITALFDEGSTVSLLDSDLAEEIGASGPVDPLNLTWTNRQQQSHSNSRRVNLAISGASGEKFDLCNVRTVSDLRLPCTTVDIARIKSSWQHLAHVSVQQLSSSSPQLLIGQDNIHLTISREVLEGPPNAPVASRTKLGWVIHGCSGLHRGRPDVHTICYSQEDEDLHEMVKAAFQADSFGVTSHQKLLNAQDRRAHDIQVSTTKRCDQRWETGLLWKNDKPQLSSNRASAMTRLLSLERKMDKQPAFGKQYVEKLEQYLVKHYAEKLSPEDAAKESATTWYLPHFGVTNPNKPGKLRVVFDAAAKSGGRSLNDELLNWS